MSNEKKSFWSSLPGILTGIAAIITAIATFLHIYFSYIKKPEPEPTPVITSAAGTEQQLINLLEQNAEGWNTNNVDQVMGVFHEGAIISRPGKPLKSRDEYEEGVRSRINSQSVYYPKCSKFDEKGDKAWLDCTVKIIKKQSGHPTEEFDKPTHFEFIRENDRWYVWRVTVKP